MDKKLEKFLRANLVYVMLIFVVFFVGIYMMINPVKDLASNIKSCYTKEKDVKNIQSELDSLKETINQKNAELERQRKEQALKAKNDKPIFKATVQSGDSFSTNTPLFEDIIKILKANKLRLISIENKTAGFDDPIVQGGGATYNTCMVSMEILGTYSQFQRFLKYLFDYPYLININAINAIPFDKDKNQLIINLSIILYSENPQMPKLDTSAPVVTGGIDPALDNPVP